MAELGPADVSVVIPTRDRWSILSQTLSALRGQTQGGFEVIVVVDGGDPRVPELPGVRLLTQSHRGPGAARNTGARASERDLVLFLGDDMIPDPSLVARHLQRHRVQPAENVAVLGHVEWHREARSRINRWLDWSSTQFDFRNIDGEEAGFGRFYSCNVSLKRSFFLAAGGFDEEFTYYYEDLDCGWRLHDHGMRLLYEPDARARHLHRYDLDGLEQRFRGVARGERLMASKHPGFEPYFLARARAAMSRPPVSPVWTLLVDVIPASMTFLRRGAERRADRWYYQRIGPAFVNAWDGEPDSASLDDDTQQRHSRR